MSNQVLAINPATDGAGSHDPSAILFEDERLVFGIEEERLTRQKHAVNTFPERAVEACLDYRDITLPEIDEIRIPWKPREFARHQLRLALQQPSLAEKAYQAVQSGLTHTTALRKLKNDLRSIGDPLPPLRQYNHHRCHAASAFYPSDFDEALVVTIDGRGESDTTVIWHADESGLSRERTYTMPNSLGAFYAHITAYLGYLPNNGEGKIMGLAPYGTRNKEIESRLRSLIDIGVNYDVSALAKVGPNYAVDKLESLFGRPATSTPGEFTEWEQDLAHVTQALLEETVADIVRTYARRLDIHNVALAGGVALNCKMNKRIMELDEVDEIFIQPVSHDAGAPVGAGMIGASPKTHNMSTVYWGPEFRTEEIKQRLSESKLTYSEPSALEETVAERLADGDLVGWFQGQLEMGPRALGNRSILADPRSIESRDRVNKFVKHRESWRPFAPSMLEEAASDYLVNAEPSPYMIKTFDVYEEKADEIAAVLHPADNTTRPQTVRSDQNQRYYDLIDTFADITGVPVILNTSFNDHGEPIVTKPVEAIKDFFGMGLDLLVLDNLIVEK